jgi:hypothetical protein
VAPGGGSVTRLGPGHVGLFLEQQGEELVRIWRLARATERPDVFPGLVDGILADFFVRSGELLATGAPPEEAWRGLAGLVRWPTSVAPAELDAEWVLVEEVLAATCESVNAAPEVSAWLAQAVAACRAGTPRLTARGEGPRAVVTALVFSSVEPPPSRHGEEETVS